VSGTQIHDGVAIEREAPGDPFLPFLLVVIAATVHFGASAGVCWHGIKHDAVPAVLQSAPSPLTMPLAKSRSEQLVDLAGPESHLRAGNSCLWRPF